MGDSVTKYKDMNDREATFIIDRDIKSHPKRSEIVKQLEKEYPIIADEFKEILSMQYELFAQKMLSYGMGNISMGSNLETKEEVKFSLTSIWIRMNDKMNRLKNLVLLGNKNPFNPSVALKTPTIIRKVSLIANKRLK